MSSPADLVREFHTVFGLVDRVLPTRPPEDERLLRAKLIHEEATEVRVALLNDYPIASVLRELADLVYVVYGTALHYGVDLDAALVAVHRANMTKAGPDGPRYRDDGKVLKPKGWQAPDVSEAIGTKVDVAETKEAP